MYAGRYWDPVSKKHTSGKGPGGRAYSAFPLDWDADGDVDLLIGTDKGGLFLRVNEGTKESPAFAEDLVDTGARVPGGYAMPVAADWDGDGRWDLVSGSQDGAIFWFRNTGQPGAPKLEAPQRLVKPTDGTEGQPARRTQVDVADFDGDGDLDLLAGDMSTKKIDGKHRYLGWIWLYRRLGSPEVGAAPATKTRDSLETPR